VVGGRGDSAAAAPGRNGTYDGVPPFPHVDAVIERDSGLRVQLRRIMDALREGLAEPTSGRE
jgi:hypothetical protein